MNTKLKPFDLEAALRGEPVETRDGREVTQVTKFEIKTKYCVAVVVNGYIDFYSFSGKVMDSIDTERDLFMATKTVKKEGWVNLYRSMDGKRIVPGGKVFDCKTKAANSTGGIDVIATVKIEWEEEA